MAKVINDFKIDLSSMAAAGAVRQFSVIGDSGAIFSLEVKNEDNKYYNFSTNTFTTTYNRLKNKKLVNGVYKGYIDFPAVGDPDQYDIYLFAESMHGTNHATYSEVRFGDGSIDINSSTGSNSNLLQKVIYQYDDVVVTLSAISPESTFQSSGGFVSMSVSSDTVTVGRGNTVGKTAFSVAVTAATDKSLQISRQPTIDDLTAYTTMTMGSGVLIKGEDKWGGTARSSGLTVNGAVDESENVTMDADVSATRWQVGDRVTGNTVLDAKTGDDAVTVAAINVGSNAKVFALSEALSINDNETLTFTPAYYHRWSIHSGSSIHTLLPGMRLWTTDSLILENRISDYEDTTTYTTQIHNDDGSIEEVENTVVNVSIPALDPLGYKPTITNGVISKQLGNVTFDNQVKGDFDGVSAKLLAYGSDSIKAIHNTEIKLTDLKVELTGVTTTTTAAVNNSTTIPVAERKGTVVNVSTISGIGIDSSVANPTVASATDEGAGNWTASAAQTLESGVTLTVGGTGKVATITGNIEFVNVDDTSFSLYFDVEKFLTAS